MQKETNKKPLIADIPFPLQDVFRMYWLTEEAWHLKDEPEAEQVQAFIKWCKEPGNVKNLNEEEKKFLQEN